MNGVFGTIFGQLLGYITAKGRGRLHGKLVEQLVFIPYLIPSVAFGGIYLSMFSQPQQIFGVTLVPALYGTFALLTLVSVVKHLPFAARAGTSNMLQISGELEEAATIEGAGFFRRFVKIVFQRRLHLRLHADLRFHHEGAGSDHPDHDPHHLHAAVPGVPVPERQLAAGI